MPAELLHSITDGPAEAHSIDRTDLIASLAATIDATLRPLLAGIHRVALIDFPTHTNVGDSVLWLAMHRYVRDAGKIVCYTCSADTYSRERLAARLGDGIILLSGGGNFGDLWDVPQQLRERVVRDFPNRPIVQLPQSVHFRHPAALARARAILDAHPNLTLLLRDRSSWEFARATFRAPSLLCPDMAFWLGALPRRAAPTTPFVWLARTDRERTGWVAPMPTTDWTIGERTSLTTLAEAWLRRQVMEHPRFGQCLDRLVSRAGDRLAHQRVRRGCAILGAARVVITDRLHGHILSLLLGIPHVLLDNSDSKVRHYYESWTHGSPLVRWADNPEQALALATELAA